MTAVPPEVAPERLTAILRRAGVLERGEVVDVAVETPRDTLVSRIVRLRLTYGGGADGGPSHVVFKTQRDGVAQDWRELGRKEATFYGLVAVATPAGLLPRCDEAVVEPAGHWHLLLEDLTASHEPVGEWPLPPPLERWDAVVAAHARFHAAWWDHERLGVSVSAFLDDAGVLDRFVAEFPRDFATFADCLGDPLSAERRLVYERLIAAAPRLLDRYRSHRKRRPRRRNRRAGRGWAGTGVDDGLAVRRARRRPPRCAGARRCCRAPRPAGPPTTEVMTAR